MTSAAVVMLFRRLGIHRYIPLDLHVTYHKTCGLLLALLSSVHTIVHLLNLELNIVQDADTNPRNAAVDDPSVSQSVFIITEKAPTRTFS